MSVVVFAGCRVKRIATDRKLTFGACVYTRRTHIRRRRRMLRGIHGCLRRRLLARNYVAGNTEQQELNTSIFENANRILIKFGSSLLVDDSTGEVRMEWLRSVADDVAKLQALGKDVMIVSSGAIAVGRRDLGFTQTKSSMALEEKQAAAAVGSIHLAHSYQEVLGAHGIVASQILVTTHDTEDRKRSVNARAAINTLLKKGSVPIINENDATSTQEIKFGDNDRLAARVSTMMGSDVCILFSDIDGVYDSDPRSNPTAHHHAFIDRIDTTIEVSLEKCS